MVTELFLSLPIGAVSAAVVVFFLRIPRQSDSDGKSIFERIKQLDLWGACLLIPTVVCLLLALQWGGAKYAWNSSRIIGLLVGFGCLATVFTITQIRSGDRGTLPPRILTQRTVLAASCFAFMFGAGFFILVFYLPIYFQAVKGVSATRSGIEVLPLMLSAVLSSIVTGGLITVVGYYTPLVIFGAALFAIGAGLISTFTITTPFARWFGYQVLTGAGVGFGFQIPIISVQTVLPLDDIAVGTACVIFFQTLGGALFVSIGETVFQNGVISGTHRYVPSLDPKLLLSVGATEIRNLLENIGKPDELQSVLQAYMVGLVNVFKVSIAVIVTAWVCTLFLEWKSVKDEEAQRKKEAAAVANVV